MLYPLRPHSVLVAGTCHSCPKETPIQCNVCATKSGRSKVGECPCRCGQLGHLTKQCKNEFSRFYGGTAGPGCGFGPEGAVSAVAAAGVLPLAGPAGALPPVAEGAAMPDLSSDLSSGSSSESDSDSEKTKRKARHVAVSRLMPQCVAVYSLQCRVLMHNLWP